MYLTFTIHVKLMFILRCRLYLHAHTIQCTQGRSKQFFVLRPGSGCGHGQEVGVVSVHVDNVNKNKWKNH